MLFVIDNFFLSADDEYRRKMYFIILAESQINGNLYGSSSSSSSQPRFGSEICISCQNGTWPDPDNQRLVIILI